MSTKLFFETLVRLEPPLRAGDFAGCESLVASVLRGLPPSPFQIAPDLSITNDPLDAALHFDRFYCDESQRLAIKALYTEMNGFDINPELWYCDLFAYTSDGGLDDFDWLSDWQSRPFERYPITGLEPLQAVYASRAFQDPANLDAVYLSSLVVVTKFQRFMAVAAGLMKDVCVPLYVTAHDYDHIARIMPGP